MQVHVTVVLCLPVGVDDVSAAKYIHVMIVCLPVGVDDINAARNTHVVTVCLPVGVDDKVHADDRMFTCWCRW